MKTAEITNICGITTLNTSVSDVQNAELNVSKIKKADVEEPKVVKVAKLAITLADSTIDIDTKICCIKVGIRMGFLTESEAAQLQMSITDLKNFREELEEANADDE